MADIFLITTPIYYTNDVPHIGHGYTDVITDVFVRSQKLLGHEVCFLTGTDEHGKKIEDSAKAAGKTPAQFVGELVPSFVKLLDVLQCKYDKFVRTTAESHKTFVQDIWSQLQTSGNIYLGKYSGWYSKRDERFYSEDELVNNAAPTGAPVEWLEEESYFFKLSAWQEKLLSFYEEHQDFILPRTRYNEVVSFVRRGLKDLSISRLKSSLSWGIPVPSDLDHVIYVWLDALFSYISESPTDFAKLHLIGKDILIFHAVYWPAFLLALNLPLPTTIFAHGWWTKDGEKISKSLGNTVDPFELVNEFGSDYVRYFMLREVQLGQDGNYTRSALVQRVNGELVNNLGNLVQRVLAFIYKNCGSVIPLQSNYVIEDKTLLNICYNSFEGVQSQMQKYNPQAAIDVILELGHAANRYMEECAPWHLKKHSKDIDRLNTVLHTLCECIKYIGILLQPFTPTGAVKILRMFCIPVVNFSTEIGGVQILQPTAVFPKILT